MTPPPTETPAPLSEDIVALVHQRLRDRYDAYAHPHSTMSADIRRLLTTISTLRARNEALEAERDLILAGFNEAQALAAEQKARAEAADSTISNLRARNEVLASAYRESAKRNSYSYTAARLVEAESTIARHVAALQEIGKGVDADQATIARLTAELAQADAVIADEDGDVLMEDRILWRNQAIARHRDRRALAVGRTEGEA